METREKILVAATELFLRDGLKSVTMDDVAARLGMSKRTIYENFANKKELLTACVDYVSEEARKKDEVIMAKAENVIDEIFMSFGGIDDKFNNRSRFIKDIQKYYPDIFENNICSGFEKAQSKFMNTLERGVAQGIISPDANLDFVVFIIMETLYNVLSRQETLLSKNVSIPDALQYVIIYFFRGISTEKGTKIMDTYIDKWIKGKTNIRITTDNL